VNREFKLEIVEFDTPQPLPLSIIRNRINDLYQLTPAGKNPEIEKYPGTGADPARWQPFSHGRRVQAKHHAGEMWCYDGECEPHR